MTAPDAQPRHRTHRLLHAMAVYFGLAEDPRAPSGSNQPLRIRFMFASGMVAGVVAGIVLSRQIGGGFLLEALVTVAVSSVAGLGLAALFARMRPL